MNKSQNFKHNGTLQDYPAPGLQLYKLALDSLWFNCVHLSLPSLPGLRVCTFLQNRLATEMWL